LEQEKYKIIEKAINDYLSKKEGIIKYLREKDQIIDLKEKIPINNFNFSKKLRVGEIGIKAIPFSDYFIKIHCLALIVMCLKIDNNLINKGLFENNFPSLNIIFLEI